MAKKETKKKEKKAKKNAPSTTDQTAAAGAGATAATTAPGTAAAGATQQIPGITNVNSAAFDRNTLTADQLTQAQIEEAIKESQDPSAKLKKLKSPLSIKGCLLNLLILVVLTIGIVLLICYIRLDKETFNLLVVVKDILNKFGITGFFQKIGDWFVRTFGGGDFILPIL